MTATTATGQASPEDMSPPGSETATGAARLDERAAIARRTSDAALQAYADTVIRLAHRHATRSGDRASLLLIALGGLVLGVAFALKLSGTSTGWLEANEFIIALIAGTILLTVGAGVGIYADILMAGIVGSTNESARDVSTAAFRTVDRLATEPTSSPEGDESVDTSR